MPDTHEETFTAGADSPLRVRRTWASGESVVEVIPPGGTMTLSTVGVQNVIVDDNDAPINPVETE